MSETTKYAVLGSRAMLRLSGPDARQWLQGLVTNDVESLGSGQARFAALLSPQGKILFDFFVTPDADGLLIDCPAKDAAALLRRLGMYKLRAQVAVSDVSASLSVAAVWGGEPPPVAQARIFPDPRDARLGWRAIGPASNLEALGEPANEGEWRAHRIACGVPEGGVDYAFGETFPHEANMDRLNGVDFRKGCYVGQEVVSRVQHRGLARKRITKVRIDGTPPDGGGDIVAGEAIVGALVASAGTDGLAMLRLDKAAEAEEGGSALRCGDAVITVVHGGA